MYLLVLTQCLCEAVVVYLSPTSPPPVPPTLASHALSQLPPTGSALSLEVASHRDIVFLLVDLWQLDSDAVRKQWVTGFFAAGLAENGSEVRARVWTQSTGSLQGFANQWIFLRITFSLNSVP